MCAFCGGRERKILFLKILFLELKRIFRSQCSGGNCGGEGVDFCEINVGVKNGILGERMGRTGVNNEEDLEKLDSDGKLGGITDELYSVR